MKYFLIIWLCINDPSMELKNTCQQLIMDQEPMNSLLECRIKADYLWKDLQNAGDIYMSTFCTSKL